MRVNISVTLFAIERILNYLLFIVFNSQRAVRMLIMSMCTNVKEVSGILQSKIYSILAKTNKIIEVVILMLLKWMKIENFCDYHRIV